MEGARRRKAVDLEPYLQKTLLPDVHEALLTDGYCVLPSVLASDQCDAAMDLLWKFVEDTSGGLVQRNEPASWYPPSAESTASAADNDPWPYSDLKFPDMFQSLGAGYVLGPMKEILAEKIFVPLFGGIDELHASKEGFLFRRPTAGHSGDVVATNIPFKLQTNLSIQCAVALTSGQFSCFPGSHSMDVQEAITNASTKDKDGSDFVALSKKDIESLREFDLEAKHISVERGQIIVYRSDLIHRVAPPLDDTSNFLSFGYVSMLPAELTPNYPRVWSRKVDSYKWTRNTDNRTDIENFYEHKRWTEASGKNETSQVLKLQRPHYRLAPPKVSIRLAELYGLLPYENRTDKAIREKDIERAIVRGVRFQTDNSGIFPDPLPWNKGPLCTAEMQTLRLSDGKDLLGQEKYLGGMASVNGKYIYGCCGNAQRVLKVDCETNLMEYIGPEYAGHCKWLRGLEIPASVMGDEEYPDGCCIALPCNAASVLKINPANNHVHTFGDLTQVEGAWSGGWAYHGGNLGCDGFVYAIPANSSRVLKIDPRNEIVECIGPSFSGMRQKWFGGIVGSDNCVWGIPHNSSGVLRINPLTQEVSVIGEGLLEEGQWKWHGGLASSDGQKIIGFPNNASSILVIDIPSQRVYTVSDGSVLKAGRHRIPQDGRYKYLGGALTSCGKYAYLFPCDAEKVLRMNMLTDDVKTVGPELLEGENKYQNGFVARDGCLYGIPQRASGVLRIVPPGINGMGEDEEHVDVMYCGEEMVAVKDKFEGGVYGPMDECIYMIPLRAKALLKIIPGPAV